MALQVVPLREGHLEDAAGLVGARHRKFLDQMPLLPPQYGETTTLLPLLRGIFKAGPAGP
jgi:hypothetical protein